MARQKQSSLPKWAITVTPFSKMLALSMLVIFPIIGFHLGRYYQQVQDLQMSISPSPYQTDVLFVSSHEKQLINSWIEKNNLNQYGDAQDTAYTGGTPLFDEASGKTMDKYEYILKNHPDKPWDK